MIRSILALSILTILSCKVVEDSDLTANRANGKIEGVVTTIDGNVARFSSASTDYILQISDIDSETEQLVRESRAKRKRIKIILPPQALKTAAKNTLGIRPDCSEQPMTYEELVAAADRSNDIVSFLKEIPKTSLQTFTLVHTSQSPLKNEVDVKFPRVVRASADTKLIVAYSCNPGGAHFNHAEVIRFDDATSEFKFSEINLGGAPGSKVHEDPSECQLCHVPSFRDPDPRPNWQMYFTWDGVFGINDDQLGGSAPDFINGQVGPEYRFSASSKRYNRPPELKQEITTYKEFRTLQANNPCYSLLPWPKSDRIDYEYFPYSKEFKDSNYHLRPNLKITEGLSHLMGKRLARKFLERPKFTPLKYVAALEALQCPNAAASDDLIKSILPKFKLPDGDVSKVTDGFQQALFYMDPRLPEGGGQRLYAMGKALGFADADWTMTFDRPNEPVYNTGLSPDGKIVPLVSDVSILRVTQSQIIEALAKDIPGLSATFGISRGESQNFGAMFQCVDDLGGQAYAVNKKKFCDLITKTMIANAAKDMEATKARFSSPRKRAGLQHSENQPNLVTDARELKQEMIDLGKKMANDICASCHSDSSEPKNLQFFKDEVGLARALKVGSGDTLFIKKVFERLYNKDKPMPPKDQDWQLTTQDVDAIAAYLNSLYLK